MKKNFVKYLLAISILIGVSHFSHAQTTKIYVKEKPTAAAETKPASPHSGYVWTGDEWTPANGTYTHVAGQWVEPRKGYKHEAGYWKKESQGYYWVPGHWKKL
jgi:hypothetical protein